LVVGELQEVKGKNRGIRRKPTLRLRDKSEVGGGGKGLSTEIIDKKKKRRSLGIGKIRGPQTWWVRGGGKIQADVDQRVFLNRGGNSWPLFGARIPDRSKKEKTGYSKRGTIQGGGEAISSP